MKWYPGEGPTPSIPLPQSSRTHLETDQKIISILVSFWDGFWSQNGPKIDPKSSKKWSEILYGFRIRFLINCWMFFASPNLWFWWQYHGFWRFLQMYLVPVLALKTFQNKVPKTPKIDTKRDQTSHRKMICFFIGFGAKMDPKMVQKWTTWSGALLGVWAFGRDQTLVFRVRREFPRGFRKGVFFGNRRFLSTKPPKSRPRAPRKGPLFGRAFCEKKAEIGHGALVGSGGPKSHFYLRMLMFFPWKHHFP